MISLKEAFIHLNVLRVDIIVFVYMDSRRNWNSHSWRVAVSTPNTSFNRLIRVESGYGKPHSSSRYITFNSQATISMGVI